MDKPRVVFVINSLTGGGAERVMSKLLRSAVDHQAEYEIALVMLDVEAQAYAVPPAIKTYQLDSRGSVVRSVRQLHAVLAGIRPDLVVSFLTRANLANVIVGKLLGHRSVISERTNTSVHHGATGLQGWLSKRFIRWLYPSATRTIAVSKGVASDLSRNFGVTPGRLEVIQNPFDIDDLEQLATEPAILPTNSPYVLGIGRFVTSKNFALLIESFAAANLRDHHLIILGHGPLELDLHRAAKTCGAADRIHFLGFVQNPFPIVKRAAAYVLCSNAEGFPNALVEAMSLGVPVVATDCASGPAEILGGGPEGSARGVTEAPFGILVPTNDRTAMTEALRQVCDPDDRETRRRRAQIGAAPYEARASLGRYWSTIAEVLGLPRRAAVPRSPNDAPATNERA